MMTAVQVKDIPTTQEAFINTITRIIVGKHPSRTALMHTLGEVKMNESDSLESWRFSLEQLMQTLTKVFPGQAPQEIDFARQYGDGLKPSMLGWIKHRNILITAATLEMAYIKASEEFLSTHYLDWRDKQVKAALLPSGQTLGSLAAATTRPANNSQKDSTVTCNFCRYKGHTEEECRKKQRTLQVTTEGSFRGRNSFRGRGKSFNTRDRGKGRSFYTGNSRHIPRDSGSSRGDRQEQKDRHRHQDRSRDPPSRTCHKCGKPNHIAKDCFSRFDVNGAPIINSRPARRESAFNAQAEDRKQYIPSGERLPFASTELPKN
jgi:hypothetical protein